MFYFAIFILFKCVVAILVIFESTSFNFFASFFDIFVIKVNFLSSKVNFTIEGKWMCQW